MYVQVCRTVKLASSALPTHVLRTCGPVFVIHAVFILIRRSLPLLSEQMASILFVELSHFHELALASKPEAVMKLLNDVFWDVRSLVGGGQIELSMHRHYQS